MTDGNKDETTEDTIEDIMYKHFGEVIEDEDLDGPYKDTVEDTITDRLSEDIEENVYDIGDSLYKNSWDVRNIEECSLFLTSTPKKLDQRHLLEIFSKTFIDETKTFHTPPGH